jgi:hypothetical protein
MLALSSIVFSQTTNSIEGKWVLEDYPNTMYILEGGSRYTYFCVSGNCDSLYSTFQAGDGNHIPTINTYTFNNDTLIIDLNFGNYFVAEVEFLCNGNVIEFINNSQSRWIRLGTNINDCFFASIEENTTSNLLQIYPNPSNGLFAISFDNIQKGSLVITDMVGKVVYSDDVNSNMKEMNLSHLQAGIYSISLQSTKGSMTTKIILE